MKRLQSIQIMRGIAASMVMLYHFGYSNSNFLAAFPSFGSLFKYGDLGVWMFFVISGFVIPYAMHSTTYRIRDSAWLFFHSAHRPARTGLYRFAVTGLPAHLCRRANARLSRAVRAFAWRVSAAVCLSRPVV